MIHSIHFIDINYFAYLLIYEMPHTLRKNGNEYINIHTLFFYIFISDRSSRDQFIAFFSTLRDDVTPISIKEVIVFDKVITNYGNAYDPYIGRFRSNVPGYYHFVTNVMSSMGHFLDVDLVRDNNVICKARATYNGMGTCAVTTYVHTNSSVWIRHAGSKGDFIKGDSFSSFTGFLLKPI